MEPSPEAGQEVKRVPARTLPTTRRLAQCAVGVAILVLVVFVPSMTGDYLTGLFTTMAMFCVVAMAWNLAFGYGGVFTLGQMAFFAIGGYASALGVIHWGFSPWVGLFFGGGVAAVAGILMGVPSLRLYGPYMVLFTLAFQLALAALLPAVWTETTGGSSGLFNLPVFAIGDWDPLTVAFYTGVAMVLATYTFIAGVLRTPVGRAMEALKEGREQAEARGISLFQHRVILFVISSFFTGTAGAFYAHYLGIMTPSVLELGLLINLLAWMVLGGLSTKTGPIVGVGVGVYVTDTLAQAQEYSQLIWGLVLVAIIAFAPGGLVRTSSMLVHWMFALSVAWLKPGREKPPMPELFTRAKELYRRGADITRAVR